MKMRRRFKQAISFRDRLASFGQDAREKAARLPPGAEKDEMLAKLRHADTASFYNDWFNSRPASKGRWQERRAASRVSDTKNWPTHVTR